MRRSSSSAYNSRTLPLPTCTGASGMHGLLLPDERTETLEDGVDVTDGGIEIEDGVEVDPCRDLWICGYELAKVALFLPRLHGVALNRPVSVVARDSCFDQREQQSVTEHEAVARVEVLPHSLRMHDQPFDDPCEPVEHVVEREECVRENDTLRRRIRDVALVPKRNVLQSDERCGTNDAREPADPFRDLRVALVRH